LIDKVPWGHWIKVNCLYGITRRGIIAPCAFTEKNTNERFLQYIQEDLCPWLRKGDK
jgi:hypothetical protein